jgi:hypothetical protein
MTAQECRVRQLSELLSRVEAAGADGLLDRQVAIALGWDERRVTRLGLNGRTPGRWEWFAPDSLTSRTLPRFTGPRKRTATIALLKALIASEASPAPSSPPTSKEP